LGMAGVLPGHAGSGARARLLRPRRQRDLSGLDVVGLGLDGDGVAAGPAARAGAGHRDRHAAHAAGASARGAPGQRLGRAVSQHSAARADFRLVPRGACARACAQGRAGLRARGAGPGLFHLGARGRAGARGHRGAAARAALRGAGAGPDALAGLSLRAAAAGVSHHHPAAHERGDERVQELVRGLCRVGRRAHHVCHAGAGGNLARRRDLSGRDRAVRGVGLCDQPRHGAHRKAPARARPRGAWCRGWQCGWRRGRGH